MRESEVEKYFVQQVALLGGVAEKFKSPGKAGVPDRIVLWPNGRVDFVELKATGEPLGAHQLRDHDRRRALGFKVFVVDDERGADWYLLYGRRMTFGVYIGGKWDNAV